MSSATATLEQAIEIAVKAHKGQVDKNGEPYILHPLRVMLKLNTETAQIVGVLHDVVEDTEVTLDDLRREGFSEQVITSLFILTHTKDKTYESYIKDIAKDHIATQVKLADLQDNTDIRRTTNPPMNHSKYQKAWLYLTEKIDLWD